MVFTKLFRIKILVVFHLVCNLHNSVSWDINVMLFDFLYLQTQVNV